MNQKKAIDLYHTVPEIVYTDQDMIPLIRKYTSRSIRNYTDPNKDTIENMRSLIESLDKEDSEKVSEFLKKLKMKGFILKEDPSVIFFAGIIRKVMAVNFLWRVGSIKIPAQPETFENPVDPMILEAPHEGSDNTLSIATIIFMNTKARALISNGIHNRQGGKGVKCQRKSYKTDGAHSTNTMFHKVHVAMENIYPYACFPQIHGMKGAKNFNILVVNCYNSRFDGPSKSCPLLFGQAVPEVFTSESRLKKFAFCGNVPGRLPILNKKGEIVEHKLLNQIYKRPTGCHNTTVTAHHLNGGGQCSLGNRDTGRFMHIEFSPRFRLPKRTYLENKLNMAKVFNILAEKWIQTPTSTIRTMDLDDEYTASPNYRIIEDEDHTKTESSIIGKCSELFNNIFRL
jgi:hypothetical protein